MSGVLSILLAMGSGRGATLVNDNYEDIVPSPSNASVAFSTDSDGGVYGTQVGVFGFQYTWRTGTGVSADYDVRATETSGTVSSGTVGSWLNLATDQTWTKTRNTVGSSAVTLTVEIRDAATLAVLDTATVTLTAEVT